MRVTNQECGRLVRGEITELDFAWRDIRAYSSRGTAFHKRIPVGMPRIPAMIRNAAFYLYPSKKDALKGENFGGTGFAIAVPSKLHAKYGRAHIYAVTNWHVAVQGSPVIRLNSVSGAPDIIEAEPHDWFFDGVHDIAVLPINLDPDNHIATALHSGMLLREEDAKAAQIGPGDDVFMVGRFMDHDGGEKNQPAFRFGNISIDPTPIMQSNGVKPPAYCVDLHSRSGFSGSPVFVYRTPGSDLEPSPLSRTPNLNLGIPQESLFFMLLGIHFAQFPELWEVTSTGKLKHEAAEAEPLLTDGKFIKGLSGMTCVLPAWSIRKVLKMKALEELRASNEAATEERFRREGYPAEPEDKRRTMSDPAMDNDGPISEAAAPPATDANPTHREDFNRLLGAAVGSKPKDDPTN